MMPYRGNDGGVFDVAEKVLLARLALLTPAGLRNSTLEAAAAAASLLSQATAEQESWPYVRAAPLFSAFLRAFES